MSMENFSEFQTVVTLLANRMVPQEWLEGRDDQVSRSDQEGFPKRKLVFLLGAGCSRQYDLPSFVELLRYLWEDFLHRTDPPSRLEVLRDQLDKFWQSQGPEDRRQMLDYYLNNRVSGAACPGYLHLARLAKSGYVKAIVNMNFDTLLEEALDAAQVSYKVATSFLVQDDQKVIVYKPHGTIGRVDSGDAIHGLQRAIEEIVEAEHLKAKQIEVLRGVFLRAKKHFEEEKEHLMEVAQDQVDTSEKLIQLGSFVLGLEKPPKGKASPGLSALRHELRSLEQGCRIPVVAKNELILDIANSDLFADPHEETCAQELLTRHDVVSLGYSGVDAKIAAALRAFPPGKDPKNKKLFVVNLSRPDPRLLHVMAERSSQDLLITGVDAAFENFMGEVVRAVKEYEPGKLRRRDSGEMTTPPSQARSSMTRAEQEALTACLRMAQEIRLSMNVAERSSTSIEEHGYKIFSDCLDLARYAGICLSSAEKYLLHCAAFLHDLGYYRGYTRAKASEFPGWRLLRKHGILTKELLEERFREERQFTLRSIVPKTYQEEEVSFENLLCTLCEGHTGLVEIQNPIGNTHILVDGIRVPVRFPLLLSLFALAEDLSEGHPFVPSPDFIGSTSAKSALVIVDPVLDLYLRDSSRPVEFVPERRRIVIRERDERGHRHTTQWLLTMASHHVRQFDEASIAEGGWGIKLDRSVKSLPRAGDPALMKLFEHLLKLALLEMLGERLKEIRQGSPGEATAILDLVSIYTMSTKGGEYEEPRVPLDKPLPGSTDTENLAPNAIEGAMHRAQEVLWQEQLVPQHGLLQHYLPRYRKGPAPDNPMERLFFESFQRIVYPAWRFFARNWHDGIEALLMARACFDLGSSPLRGETLGGVKRLLDEKVVWDPVNKDMAYGHDKCTLCTSRLLYVLTNARRLVSPADFNALDRTIKGILSYMLSLDPCGEIWWGLDVLSPSRSTIHSADYLAWAARSVGFALSVDLELSSAGSQERWLSGTCGFDLVALQTLLRQRWDQLFAATEDDLLNPLAEEPHSFIFGHVALACLDLKRWNPKIQQIASSDAKGQTLAMANTLRAEVEKIGIVSQLSRFYLWPVELLADSFVCPGSLSESTEAESDAAAVAAVKICYSCVHSPVWIKGGGDAGSWGFNVKNTQAIVTSLVEFWRYVLQNEQQEKRFADIFRRLAPDFGRPEAVS